MRLRVCLFESWEGTNNTVYFYSMYVDFWQDNTVIIILTIFFFSLLRMGMTLEENLNFFTSNRSLVVFHDSSLLPSKKQIEYGNTCSVQVTFGV
jgi:hypothetical protein